MAVLAYITVERAIINYTHQDDIIQDDDWMSSK